MNLFADDNNFEKVMDDYNQKYNAQLASMNSMIRELSENFNLNKVRVDVEKTLFDRLVLMKGDVVSELNIRM